MPARVRIFRWRRTDLPYGNFGDEITVPLLRKLFGIEAIPVGMREAELLGAGSILDAWARTSLRRKLSAFLSQRRAKDLHVWGSGFILPDTEARWPQRLHFHAVRGALTAQRSEPGATVGDPGILASTLLDKMPSKISSVGFVPHYTDVECAMMSVPLPRDWCLIDPRGPVETVVHAIAACELVVASSLHGLIVADSFGIPCVWARSSRPLYGASDFKFHDHATARRTPFNAPLDYPKLATMKTAEIAAVATVPGRSVEPWQHELIAAFPGELVAARLR